MPLLITMGINAFLLYPSFVDYLSLVFSAENLSLKKKLSKKEDKDQESIQSSTARDPGYQ